MLLFDDPILDGWIGRAPRPPGPAYPRRATRRRATLVFAGHSFVQTAYGTPVTGGTVDPFGGLLAAEWPGTALSDYVPNGWLAQVRELDGHLIHADYDAAIVSEFADIGAGGFPALDSVSGRNSLQQLYWCGLNAAARGAELVLQDVWEPQGMTLATNIRGFFQGAREWLQSHLGRPVWIIPTQPFVAALRAAYGDAIYDDGLHLGRSSAYARGMSYLVYSFLTQGRCPFVRPGDEAIDQLAWDTLLTHECAGMGGTVAYGSALPGIDPLPDPLPLPDAGPVPPVNTAAPSLSGIARVGDMLTAAVGSWEGTPPLSFEYRWQGSGDGLAGWTVIAGASQPDFVPQAAHAGLFLAAEIRAVNAAGPSAWIRSPALGPVAAAEGADPGWLDMDSARILFIGNSMTDSLFSGSADTRQTLGRAHPTAPQRFRKFTIPGSTQGITWDQRFGAPGGQAGGAGPFDPMDPQTIAYPGRDMDRFDAACWSTAGPFPQLPDPDFWNDTWRQERDAFRNWSNLCDQNGVRKFFMTFPPATDWTSFSQPSNWPAFTDPDAYECYLSSQRRAAEEWVAEVDPAITIIPKTELWRELHRRCRAGTFPGTDSGSTTPLLQNDPPEMGLVIHPTHLGSIFEAAFVWYFLTGQQQHIPDPRLAEMLAEGSYAVTPADIRALIEASLQGYRQGTGYGLVPPPGWSGPARYADLADLAATVPALAITGTVRGAPLVAGNHAFGVLGAAGQPLCFYALLDIEFGPAGSQEIAPLIAFYQDQGGIWDPKYVGVTVHNGINGLYLHYRGASRNAAFTPGARQIWEFAAAPDRLVMHVIDPANAWGHPVFIDQPPSSATRFGINAHEWTNGTSMIPETFATGHTLHGGWVYDAVPSTPDRLRLQKLMTGDYS